MSKNLLASLARPDQNYITDIPWEGTGPDRGNASRVPHQRSMFHANGRFWLFYTKYDTGGEPYDMGWVSTQNIRDWTTFQALSKPCHFADAGWNILHDGTYVHITKNIEKGIVDEPSDLGTHRGLEYRRGETNPDGSITWSAAWQTVLPTTTFVGDHSTTITTDGKIVVAYNDGPFRGNTTVIKNDNTDGTWANAAGFPVSVTAFDDSGNGVICALQNGGWYCLYYKFTQEFHKARGYYSTDGSSTFVDDGEITDENMNMLMFVAPIEIAEDGDGIVHLTYLAQSENIIYKSRATNGTWSSETIISNRESYKHTPAYSSPRLSFDQNGNIYVVWSDALRNKLMGKRFTTAWSDFLELAKYDIIFESPIPRTCLITVEKFHESVFTFTDLKNNYNLTHGFVAMDKL